MVAHWAHNPKVTGSSPVSATESTVNNRLTVNYGAFLLDKEGKIKTPLLDDSGAISGGSTKKKMPERKNSSYEVNVRTYTPPRLSKGKSCFIAFNSYDPASETMKRKRIYLNAIKSKKMRKDYADELIKRLNAELKSGWNPWIENKCEKSYNTLDEVSDAYRRDIKDLYGLSKRQRNQTSLQEIEPGISPYADMGRNMMDMLLKITGMGSSWSNLFCSLLLSWRVQKEAPSGEQMCPVFK